MWPCTHNYPSFLFQLTVGNFTESDMSATCWLWFASCQWGIPISLRPPLPFIFLFTIHLTTYRGGRILVISCWIGNLTRSLTSNGDSDPRAFQLTASRGGWQCFNNFLAVSSPFQLTASRGGWRRFIDCITAAYVFQLTASRGGWLDRASSYPDVMLFQLTASRGGWPASLSERRQQEHFNSQPHEEAD